MVPFLLSYEIAIVRDIDTGTYSIVFGIKDQSEEQRAVALPLVYEASNGWKVRSYMQSDISVSKKTVHILGIDRSGDVVDRFTRIGFPTINEALEVYDAITMALEEWEANHWFEIHDETEVVIEKHHPVGI